jgi:hypothetical protein
LPHILIKNTSLAKLCKVPTNPYPVQRDCVMINKYIFFSSQKTDICLVFE